jgi:hypothetical protein
MPQRLAPMLFDDSDKNEAQVRRRSVVAQAQRSKAAVSKQTTGLTEDGLPVHSFRSPLADLATLARNTMTTAITPGCSPIVLTRPRPIQRKAFKLLGIAVFPVAKRYFEGLIRQFSYFRSSMMGVRINDLRRAAWKPPPRSPWGNRFTTEQSQK